ncbi:transglutaminase-like domain-containing protein [Leifsonia kafniensis]|uniref:Transglutaminase-like domain-containing protein n=1 Tax=Leifsonia kafniensis TaxID=475957 RepID=A0ABP7L618_9MICO
MRAHSLPEARSTQFGFLLTNALFVFGMVAVGLWAAWPIYQSGYFFITAGGAVLAATVIAWVGMRRAWSWFTLLLVTFGVYLLLGVPLAVPAALTSLPAFGSGFVNLITATVFSWKELVTISIPVGSYQTMLVPLLILTLGVTTAALSLVWRAPRLHTLAIPVVFLLQLFGLVAGSSRVSTPLTLGFVTVPAPRESLIGLAVLLLAVAFLVWRAQDSRQSALRQTTQATGVRQLAQGWLPRARRGALVVGTVLLATVVAVPLVASAVRPAEREVLRTGIDPAVTLREYVSPLSQYRSFLTGDLYDTPLFTVSGASADLSRLRLAVLSHYDGQVFRVVDPVSGEKDQTTAFARVPNIRDSSAQSGTPATATVTSGSYDGVWLPLAGSLTRIDFTGPRRDALTDAFYYSDRTDAGVELRTLSSGDSYRFETRIDESVTPIAELKKPAAGGELVDPALIPESLVNWVKAQKVGADGAGLAELITRLRERGYLSHALDAPASAGGWANDLAGYDFAPSLSGHSVDRIDSLFTSLLEKQNSTVSTDNAVLVAAVGDDEQFAVASALIAAYLGYPARVVLGFALTAADGDAEAIPACTDGVCEGKNLTAWLEVQGADERWTPVTVTPQHDHPLAPSDDQMRDPKIPTDVLQAEAAEQTPPEANPTSGEEKATAEKPEAADLGWLIGILKIVGISLLVLLILLTPALAIIGAKMQRRRERKRGTTTAAQIAGGWDEYVDTAVDHGLPAPHNLTRTELAALHGSEGGGVLATLADQAVFGPIAPVQADSDSFWVLVDSERDALGQDATRRKRLRAALSLRSFARVLGTRQVRRYDYFGLVSRRQRRTERERGGASATGLARN